MGGRTGQLTLLNTLTIAGECSAIPTPLSLSTAELEKELRLTFSVEEKTVCRVWHRYMSHTYELLSDSNQTLQDAGLYNMQVWAYFNILTSIFVKFVLSGVKILCI